MVTPPQADDQSELTDDRAVLNVVAEGALDGADATGAGHFGPNPATNPSFTHLGTGPATVPDGHGGSMNLEGAHGHSEYPRQGAPIGQTIGKAAGGVGGGWLGAMGGGAAAGSFVGPGGAFIGAILGAALFGFGGEKAGEAVGGLFDK